MVQDWKLQSICPATWEYIEKGKLSLRKIRDLSEIRLFVDRLATKPYLPQEVQKEIFEKFGETPSMLTWGDYFQAELAEEHYQDSDEEFQKIVQTVRFDVIAAKLIFQNKDAEFLEFVDIQYQTASQKLHRQETITREEEEFIHLGLLKGYFENLGLAAAQLMDSDHSWFNQFSLNAQAI